MEKSPLVEIGVFLKLFKTLIIALSLAVSVYQVEQATTNIIVALLL